MLIMKRNWKFGCCSTRSIQTCEINSDVRETLKGRKLQQAQLRMMITIDSILLHLVQELISCFSIMQGKRAFLPTLSGDEKAHHTISPRSLFLSLFDFVFLGSLTSIMAKGTMMMIIERLHNLFPLHLLNSKTEEQEKDKWIYISACVIQLSSGHVTYSSLKEDFLARTDYIFFQGPNHMSLDEKLTNQFWQEQ